MNDQRAPRETTINSEYLYRGKIVTLRIDTIRLPDGQEGMREIIEHPGAVVIIPVDANGQVLLVSQYRKAADRWLLELPAGGLKPGEDPFEAARRELAEEVGMAAGEWTSWGGFYSAPGFCSEFLHLYLATGLSDYRLPGDPDEDIEVIPVSVADSLDMIEAGEIIDAKTIAGLSRLALVRATPT